MNAEIYLHTYAKAENESRFSLTLIYPQCLPVSGAVVVVVTPSQQKTVV